MPVGHPSFSRQNSTTSLASVSTPALGTDGFFTPTAPWIESWLSELPLHTMLTLIAELAPQIPASTGTADSTATALSAIRHARVPRGIDPAPIRVHLFEWSPLSLGWYESLLWGFIFAGEMLVAKGTAGVWNGTAIRLFKVQEAAAQTPTLLAPRGAVDAVGSNLVQRIGSLNLRGAATQGAPRGAASGAAGGGNGGAGAVRDV